MISKIDIGGVWENCRKMREIAENRGESYGRIGVRNVHIFAGGDSGKFHIFSILKQGEKNAKKM